MDTEMSKVHVRVKKSLIAAVVLIHFQLKCEQSLEFEPGYV